MLEVGMAEPPAVHPAQRRALPGRRPLEELLAHPQMQAQQRPPPPPQQLLRQWAQQERRAAEVQSAAVLPAESAPCAALACLLVPQRARTLCGA